MFPKFTTETRCNMKGLALIITLLFSFISITSQANCKDPALREKVAQTAQSEGVNEMEILSIIAHESNCNYFTIAWNLPRRPETAKSKKFQSLEEAKEWAKALITTKLYRVDVGIGQINNEAHIQPKKWSLDEILNPLTALKRVAQVLKERGWEKYHSSNPALAKKWRMAALAGLNRIDAQRTAQLQKASSSPKIRRSTGPLIVFNKNPRSARLSGQYF